MPSPQYGTLVGDVVTVVELDRDYQEIEVLHRGGDDAIFFRVGTHEPEIEGDGSQCVPPGGWLKVPVATQGNTLVRLISASNAQWGVRGIEGVR